MKKRDTIALQRQKGICRGFKKKVEDERVKCHGNPSSATNRNWKKVTKTPMGLNSCPKRPKYPYSAHHCRLTQKDQRGRLLNYCFQRKYI